MNPGIRLSRIIALEWYGYRRIIPVDGLTLLCGETGTGKTVLLDLIQFVLCPAGAKYNKAAASEGGRGRDLRSYCLCDTNTRNRRFNQPNFLRQNGVTVAALEFEWPRPQAGETPRRETWGLRVEYQSPNAEPEYVRFFAPARLEKENFCDDEGSFLEADIFKRHVERELGGGAGFVSHGAFAEEMAVPGHLHFDSEQMRRTLPKAIALEVGPDYEDFIRKFILERRDLDVRSTKQSLEALRETEQRVMMLDAQFIILAEVTKTHAGYVAACRERALFTHLRPQLDHVEATEKLAVARDRLAALEKRHGEDLADLRRAVDQCAHAKEARDAIRFAGGKEDEALTGYERIKKDHENVGKDLAELRTQHRTLHDSLRAKVRAWREWLAEAEAIRWEADPDEHFLTALADPDPATAAAAVPGSMDAFNTIRERTQEALLGIKSKYVALEKECAELRTRLERVQRGSARPTPLLDTLRREGITAHALDRSVEVAAEGEPWWGVIETLLGDERSAVLLTDPTDFARAFAWWKQTPEGEALVNPREAAEAGEPPGGSLASLLECRHPAARGFLAARLGRFKAVRAVTDLEAHPAGAATPDGWVNDPPVRRRVEPERELSLGEKGLAQLRQRLEENLTARSLELDGQRRRITEVEDWLQRGTARALHQDTRPEVRPDPAQTSRLELRLAALGEALRQPANAGLEDRWRQIKAWEDEITRHNQRIGELKPAVTQYGVSKRRLEEAIELADAEVAGAVTKCEQSRGALPADVTENDLNSHLELGMKASDQWQTRRDFAAGEVARCQGDTNEYQQKRNDERKRLQAEPHGAEYGDFDPADDDNTRYDDRLATLNEQELPKNKTLAASQRVEWEKRLQDDVLEKLGQHLEEAGQTLGEFQRLLRTDVGKYRYVLGRERDSVYVNIWRLLEQPTHGFQLGDALHDHQLREEIEAAKRELMEAVEHPEDQRFSAMLDYRNYHHYHLHMIPSGHADDSEGAISLRDRRGNLSGGEAQAPAFVAMLAAFHRVYEPSARSGRAGLGLVVMDEAFSKLSAAHIADCLELAEKFDLQLVLAFPMDRLTTMFEHADSIVQCRVERRYNVQGVPSEIINDVICWDKQQLFDEVFS